MSAPWFRVPMWCYSVLEGENAARARAWIYILGSWHAGDDPSTREIRRVTGFGGTRADTLVAKVTEWAIANGAAVPPRVAGQHRGTNGAVAGQVKPVSTPTSEHEQGGSGAVAGQHRGARARVPFTERETENRPEEKHTQEGAVDAAAEDESQGGDLTALWSALVAFTPKPSAWKLTPKRRAQLQQRVAAYDVATVERVAEWVRTSNHHRAQFLRGHGDPNTLLRPGNFDTYAAMSASPAPQVVALRPAQGARNGRGTLASDLFTDDDLDTPARPHAVDAAWSSV
jgi:hypothetical protein